jgi:sterol-4alpha-carboxylate 3-dehydrogenase (decarboxylating)
MAPSKRTTLVVGGAGFLGKHIVQQLLDTKRYNVRVFDIRACGIPGADMIVGDIRKQEDVTNACKGVDVVVHVATATPTSENALNKQLMDDVNVKGTAHVVEACKQLGITSLIYTSSASGGCPGGGCSCWVKQQWRSGHAQLLMPDSHGHVQVKQ